MRKELDNTKATVRLRKSAYRKEWYLYIESYPVRVAGKESPQRVREYLNRTITTPIWDKSRTARTTEATRTFKPKRDLNGIILCKSEIDQEACIYADSVRKLRQREYDNASLYSDTETAQAEQKERLQQNFIKYFDKVADKRHSNSSLSIQTNWERVHALLKMFAGDTLLFSQIDNRLAEDFKFFLLSAPCGGSKKGQYHETQLPHIFLFLRLHSNKHS